MLDGWFPPNAHGHHGVADGHREGAVLRRAHGAELEAVAAEGEGGLRTRIYSSYVIVYEDALHF